MRLLSAEAQRLAPPGSTYGYDVLVRLGWQRQHQHATYREIHHDLSARLAISEAHVRYLYQHVYVPLLACHERQPRGRLARAARARRLDHCPGWPRAPRRRATNLVHARLIHGADAAQWWLAQLDQPTFEAFLAPLKHLEWPIVAMLSDSKRVWCRL